MSSNDSTALNFPSRRAPSEMAPQAGNETYTVIARNLTVIGDLVTDGHMEVAGVVRGTINARSVTVRPGGEIEGSIIAETATIRGSVLGPIQANSVTVGNSAHIVGSIFHNSLKIEPGAFLEGRRPWRPHIDRNQDLA